MKTLKPSFPFLLALLMPMAMAADTTTTTAATTVSTTDTAMASETELNNKLIENSKAAQSIIDAKNGTQVEMKVNHLSGLKSSTQKNLNDLTDQDKQLSENYLHQGLANSVIEKNCSGDMAAVCQGQAGNHKFMGMSPAMIQALSKAYAMFGSMSDAMGVSKGGGASKTASADGAKDGAKDSGAAKDSSGKGSEKKEKANDYCKYIPTATEGIATAVQTAATQSMSGEETGGGDTAQKDSLLKAAKSHDSRAKMAQIQAMGWYGGGACYAVGVATGKFAMDKNVVLKIGASVLLGSFYQSEVAANKEYAEKTRAIANQLPNKGDCNPITDNLCYCSQPSTENDPTYCMKTLHKKALALNSYRIACTTDKLALDPTCSCEASNSCFEKFLENQSESTLQLGLGYGTSPFSSIRSLARGELVGGTVNSQSFDAMSAIAKKALKELSAKLPVDNQPLSPDQKALADAYLSRGIPSNLAASMARTSMSQSEMSAATAKISGSASGYKMASVSPTLNKNSVIVDFSGGNGLGVKGASAKKSNDDFSAFRGGQKTGAAINSKILEFAQKAEDQARANGQIRPQNDKPIFEIISLRYQISGRRLLEVDASN